MNVPKYAIAKYHEHVKVAQSETMCLLFFSSHQSPKFGPKFYHLSRKKALKIKNRRASRMQDCLVSTSFLPHLESIVIQHCVASVKNKFFHIPKPIILDYFNQLKHWNYARSDKELACWLFSQLYRQYS